MIRIGIIGCGRILAAHLEGYKILRDLGVEFEITALCARQEADAVSYIRRGEGPPQRPAVSKLPGDPLAVGDQYLSDFQPDVPVAVYTDYRKMIGEAPIDAINDFTTHGMHHPIALHAFACDKHVLSQKPLAVSMEAARRMCEAAAATKLTFGVFENLRFVPMIRHYAWAFAEGGPAGRLQMALMGNAGNWWAPDLIVAETPWRHDLKQGGGISLDLGPHFFDMIRHIGGSEIESVSGQTEIIEPVRHLLRNGKKVSPIHCDADDTYFASFQTQSGASGMMFGSWAGQGGGTLVAEGPVFYGSRGRVTGDEIHLQGEDSQRCLSELYKNDAPAEIQKKDFPLGMSNDFALAQYDWLQAIASGSQPECSGYEGFMDLACAYAVVESSLAGRRMTVDEVADGSVRAYQIPIDAHFGLF